MIYVLSISGGKDSAALWSWAKRTNLGGAPAMRPAVGCDTGWEADFESPQGACRWHEYVDALAASIGEPVTIVKAARQFEERTRVHNTFPGRVNRRRWCTEELKLEPFRDEVDRIRERTGDEVTVVLGIRAEESDARAKMPEREWSDFYDCEVWRPLLGWTLAEVMAEHHKNGLPINPLYKLGAERVGCWPCIKASKAEIRLVSDLDPARIDRIRKIEEDTGNRMFCLESSRAGRSGEPREMIPKPIDEIVAWAHTTRGGFQLSTVHEPSGCARWGLCEAPVREAVEGVPNELNGWSQAGTPPGKVIHAFGFMRVERVLSGWRAWDVLRVPEFRSTYSTTLHPTLREAREHCEKVVGEHQALQFAKETP